ncbi:MAG: peptidase S8 [Elusimicrobia bacterium CG11_big_fil_rev_8_21_14_0_20_64_6]|nr:MAG: peptidase S8 [Elusimicrobia bacterium CG11_big_fil_rev_8_21_14_0_20_64_6]
MSPLRPSLVILALILASSARAQFCPLDAGDTIRKIVACKPGVATDECRRLAQSVGCAVVRELPSINAIVIELPAFRADGAEVKLMATDKVDLVETDKKVNWLKAVALAPAAAAPFEFGAANAILARIAELKPTVTADPEQPWGIRRVNAEAAWTSPRGQGQGTAIAIIDTGISRTHPDLVGVVIGGFNALDPKNPGKWDDDQGHGSHVAGTIAGKRDGKGVVGVAPLAKLYAVKVLDADGNGGFSDVIAGIEWAASHGIKVANMSLGADEGSTALKRAVTAANKAGLLIVAAAGNSGGPVGFPANYPEALAIAASDIKDGVAEFSSRGPEVDFIAPGVNVKSVNMAGGWEELSGTSMATPHVAGLAVLAVARGASTPAAIRAMLRRAATPLPSLSSEFQGLGMIDAGKLR